MLEFGVVFLIGGDRIVITGFADTPKEAEELARVRLPIYGYSKEEIKAAKCSQIHLT